MHDGKGVGPGAAVMTRLQRFLDETLAPGAIGALPAGPALVIGADPAEAYALPEEREAVLVQPFRPAFDALAASGRTVVPSLGEAGGGSGGGPVALAIVHPTRNRRETLGRLAAALERLHPEGLLVVDGQKTEGIDALLRQIRKIAPPLAVEARRHGKVFALRPDAALLEAAGGWAEAARPRRNQAGFTTAPGMFSWEDVDPGSALLAEKAGPALRGRVADLGAGWGWLAAQALANEAVTAVDLIEADHGAIEAARQNVTDPRARFRWEDVLRLGPEAEGFDAVITNPPFHQDRRARPELGIGFIGAAARILKPRGTLYLVANRHLPYERAMESHFRNWEIIAETPAFKLFEASRPIPPSGGGIRHRRRR